MDVTTDEGITYQQLAPIKEFEANEEIMDLRLLPSYIGRRSLVVLEEMPISDLFELISEKPEWVAPTVQLHRHFAFPFAPLFLYFLTVSLVLNNQNRNMLLGVGLSIIFSFSFYGAIIVSSGAAIQGDLPADYAIFIAIAPFAIVGSIMYLRLRT